MSKSGTEISPKIPPAGTAKAELFTWSTHADGGNGMAHFIDAEMFGGNVGHASVAVTFPADEAGLQLIRKYCVKVDGTMVLPFERKYQEVMGPDNKPYTTEVYSVYFSWWPDKAKGFNLKSNTNTDALLERAGVDLPLAERFTTGENAIPQEQRRAAGTLGSQMMHLPPHEIRADNSALTPEQQRMLDLKTAVAEKNRDVESLEVILKKLPEDISEIKIQPTLRNLLNHYFPAPAKWQSAIGADDTIKKLTQAQMETVRAKVNEKIATTKTEMKPLTSQLSNMLSVIRARQDAEIVAEVKQLRDLIRDNRISPSEQKIARANGSLASPRAWVAYTIQDLEKKSRTLNALISFTGANYEFSGDSAQVVKNAIFNKQFPEDIDDPEKQQAILVGWRELLPPQHKKITADTLTKEIFDQVRSAAQAQKLKITEELLAVKNDRDLVRVEDRFVAGDFERFHTPGLSADNHVVLSVGAIGANDPSFRPGLNVENMLAKMQELTQDKVKFDLHSKNCSVTTGAILAAGAAPELRSYLEEKAWGGFGNPQEVLNGAIAYQKVVVRDKGKKPFADKIAAYNPLNFASWLGGKILKGMAAPDTGILATVGLGVAGVAILPLVGATEAIKAFSNPIESLQNCTRFLNYAWSKDSIALKILSAPVAGLAGILAAPAGIQYAINAAVSPFTESKKAAAAKIVVQTDPNADPNLPDPKLQSKAKTIRTELYNTVGAREALRLAKEVPVNQFPQLTPRTFDNVVKKAEAYGSIKTDLDATRNRTYATIQNLVNPPLPSVPTVTKLSTKEKFTLYQKNMAAINEKQNIKQVGKKDFYEHPNRLLQYSDHLLKEIEAGKKQLTSPKDFKKYYSYINNIKQAAEHYGDKLTYQPLTAKQFMKQLKDHPNLLLDFSKQLLKDKEANLAPTKLLDFRKDRLNQPTPLSNEHLKEKNRVDMPPDPVEKSADVAMSTRVEIENEAPQMIERIDRKGGPRPIETLDQKPTVALGKAPLTVTFNFDKSRAKSTVLENDENRRPSSPRPGKGG